MSKVNFETVSGTPRIRFMGRQPILDKARQIYGHELLFRSGMENGFSGDPEIATRDVIDHLLLLMPSDGTQASFVNCTREALVSGIVTLLPPKRTVLEILESVRPDEELIRCCLALKSKGYRFALDDFSPEEVQRPFLAVADFIKVDFQQSDAKIRRSIYAMAAGTKATFIAEKVEAEDDVKAARKEGCDLFQGYFFFKPAIVQTRVIPENQFVYLRLLAALTRSPADLTEIEGLVQMDTSICYRLLRLVNSSLYGLRSQVTSVRTALLLVGEDEFRKMVTVALATRAGQVQSHAVIQMALQRARFCELLAPVMNESPSKLYLLGMLSLIDIILGMPMTQLLEALPLELDMKAALLGLEGGLGRALEIVQYRETGDWHGLQELHTQLRIPESEAAMFYVNSVVWADRAMHA